MILVSTFLKIASFGITDPVYTSKIDRLIDANIERYATNALVKLVILVVTLNPTHLKHRDLLMERLRLFNPEYVSGNIYLMCHLVFCIS